MHTFIYGWAIKSERQRDRETDNRYFQHAVSHMKGKLYLHNLHLF